MQRNTFIQLDLLLCILERPSLETVLNPELSPTTATTKCFTVLLDKTLLETFQSYTDIKAIWLKAPLNPKRL